MQPDFLSKYSDYIGEKEVEVLLSHISFTEVPKNKILIHTNRPVKDVFYISKGIVRLFTPDENGCEVITHIAWDGMFITSLHSLISNKVSDESVEAVTDCKLYHIKHDKLTGLYDSFPRIERMCRVIIEEAFSCVSERGRMLQTMTAKERYLNFMKTVPTEVFQALPLQVIASYLGIAPGSLSRIRNELLHIC